MTSQVYLKVKHNASDPLPLLSIKMVCLLLYCSPCSCLSEEQDGGGGEKRNLKESSCRGEMCWTATEKLDSSPVAR